MSTSKSKTKSLSSKGLKAFYLLGLALFILLYLFRLSHVSQEEVPEDMLVKVVGRISKQPYLKGSNQIISVGPVLVKTSRFPGYFYGQRIEVIGKFQKEVLNPFQSRFVTYYPSIQVLEEGEDLEKMVFLRQILFQIRGHLEKTIERLFSEPESSLLNGILLGSKREMPEKFWQELRETGTLHVIVASGYNLSVIAGVLVSGLVWLMNRKKALILALLGMILYTLMVGAEPPVVRALLMAGVAFSAQALGRENDGLIALVLAGMMMLLVEPLLLFDLGFQLSFMATAGILLVEPLLKGKLFSLPLAGEELKTTLAAQLGVMPLLLYHFSQVSLLSPLVNGLVLPVVPIIMGLGALTLLLGLFISPLGQVIGWVTWLLLRYFVIVIQIFSRFSWASLKIETFSLWWVAAYYLAFLALILHYQKRRLK